MNVRTPPRALPASPDQGQAAWDPASLFKAFADPTRLRILSLVARGEVCVGDLVRALEVPQPTASRHLAHLRGAGLVRTRRQGQWIHYSLAEGRSELHRRLVECVRSCLAGVPELEADAGRMEAIERAGGCCPAPVAAKERP